MLSSLVESFLKHEYFLQIISKIETEIYEKETEISETNREKKTTHPLIYNIKHIHIRGGGGACGALS